MKRILLILCALFFVLAGCSDDPDVEAPDVGHDAGDDVTDEDDADVDNGEESVHVPYDLSPYFEGAPDPQGTVSVYEVTDAADLIEGVSATGQVGDFMLENDRVRFLVEGDRPKMSVCSEGGIIVDAEYRSDSFGGDIMGEFCIYINADQTFKPEIYEILHDGSDGPGVLAVTGRTSILEFLNLEVMIAAMGESLANMFQMKPDELFPLRITKYYILRPGDLGVRVVTALRNDGEERLDILMGQLFVGEGDGGYFNPLSEQGGFGYVDQGLANTSPAQLPFVAYMGEEAGVAWMPQPDEDLVAPLPIAGVYLTLHNVVAAVLGQTDIILTLLASREELATRSGVFHMEPGDIEAVEHWMYVTDGSLSRMVDVIYGELDVDTGAIEGEVRDSQGALVAGARVTAIDSSGRTMNQTLADDAGAYQMRVPAGDYEVSARHAGQFTPSAVSVSVAAGDTAGAGDIVTEFEGTVVVSVQTPDADPTPARVTLICEGPCPNKTTPNEWDVLFDGLPSQFATVEWVGVSGELEFTVPAGSYRVVVSRGMEWSLWPADAHINGGELIEVMAGDSVEIQAEIAQVVDSSGSLSGDFHVHAIASHDSTTPEEDRILTFLTEGVDVVVSSDHDVIADFGPAVTSLGAEDEITTIVGTEITTSDIGHINGFPVLADGTPRGGALDWGDGDDPSLPPAAIFDWIREFPGEQVVQLNHPDSSYLRFSDVLRGISYGNHSRLRVDMPDYDPATGETGIWSEAFSAMELINGHNMERFWGVARWWLTMIGRGHRPAGTAVTDTHARFRDVLGGVPRTYVFVDDDKDSPATFDVDHFVEAINSQRVVGTTGPFVRVTATNDAGDSVGLGGVLETGGETVTFEVIVEVPEWIDVNRIQMVMNSEDVITEASGYNTDPIPATQTVDFELTEDDLDVVATGALEHRRYRKVVEIEVDTEVDAYVVFFVRGAGDMYPVVPRTSVRPFAFTNPIYLDADGGGYNNPHLAPLAQTDPPSLNPLLLQGAPDSSDLTTLSDEEILEIVENSDGGVCRH